jgi:hypothetical protein
MCDDWEVGPGLRKQASLYSWVFGSLTVSTGCPRRLAFYVMSHRGIFLPSPVQHVVLFRRFVRRGSELIFILNKVVGHDDGIVHRSSVSSSSTVGSGRGAGQPNWGARNRSACASARTMSSIEHNLRTHRADVQKTAHRRVHEQGSVTWKIIRMTSHDARGS